MTAQSERLEREAAARERAGLPVLRCPKCGAPQPHFVPPSINDRGYFTCQTERVS